MTTPTDKVRHESELFRASLSELLKTVPGRWVIFKDGQVQGDFLTEKEAYDEAIVRFGPSGGFLVSLVQREVPGFLTPLHIYRLA